MRFLTQKNRAEKNTGQRHGIFSAKKTLSLITIATVFAIFGGLISFVRASYIEPAGSPTGNNTPAPIITADVSGNSPQRKLGRFAIMDAGIITSNAELSDELVNSVLAVPGQIGTDGLFSAARGVIRSNLEASSSLFPLFVGDPTISSFQQSVGGKPLLVTVDGYTRAPRVVIGSKSALAELVNLYVEPGNHATNLGKSNDYSTYASGPGGQNYSINGKTSFCTLTATNLANTGCPAGTYLSQVVPGSGSAVVAVCRDLIQQNTNFYPYSNYNKGAC